MTAPNILKETARGIQPIRLLDDMFARRQLNVTSMIDHDMVNSTIASLRYLEQQDPEAPITMYIDSPGGEVASGLALYDVMKMLSCPVNTVCVGLAASMAALLFVAGAHREMLPHSRIMIHDPLISSIGGNALSVKAAADDLMRIREISASLLAENTGMDIEEVYKLTMKDTYFEAEEAIEYGLADAIATTI